MGKLSLKSVFSAPLIVIYSLRKIKINSFVGGLIFGALFSLLVNVVTIQIQELVQKQRILEAVENEILNNTLRSKNILTTNNENITKKDTPNLFHDYYRYTNDLWTQSTEPLQYLVQLDPQIQTKVILYYTYSIRYANHMEEKYEEIADKQLENCYDISILNSTQTSKCNNWYWTILGWEAGDAEDMFNKGMDVLAAFHPTKDRLNNTFLKLLMGDRSTVILSGK